MSDAGTVAWEPIEALSREMHRLAAEEEWELLVEKEAVRRQLLESYFARPVRAEDAPQLASQIMAMMTLDRELQRIFLSAREAVSLQMGAIKLGHKMKAAYSN